jgi:hypothetical protein
MQNFLDHPSMQLAKEEGPYEKPNGVEADGNVVLVISNKKE